jgi:predicted RNA-binding protein with RPS1 domain
MKHHAQGMKCRVMSIAENKMSLSMKFAVHRQRYEKLCTVRKQIQRYEKDFKGMKPFVPSMKIVNNGMKKICMV